MNRYIVSVSTGGEPLAQLYPHLSIQLCGIHGYTPVVGLEPDDIFALDTRCKADFNLELPDIGSLTQCWIGYDNQAHLSGHVAGVRVRESRTLREWEFRFTPPDRNAEVSTLWVAATAHTAKAGVGQ